MSGPAIEGMVPAKGIHMAWRMLVIAFVAQNCAIGMNFGIYGTIVTALEEEYQTNRTVAASGLAVMTMVMGLLSPLVGKAIRRFSLRAVMLTGTLICAAGYVLLALAPSIEVVLAVYAVVIGSGVCMLGVIPSSTLVSNWFEAGRGRALGFVNMPMFVFLFPLLTAFVVGRFGLDGVFLMAAGISLAIVPLLMCITDTPQQSGWTRYGEDGQGQGDADQDQSAAVGPLLEGRALHGNRAFQVIWLGIGLLTAAGVMLTVHIVPMAVAKGMDLQSASLLLSAFGISAALGALMFGWLADRIGGQAAIVVQALSWIVPWILLLILGANLPLLVLAAGLAGLVSGGIVGLCGVLVSTWLGPPNFALAMGHVYFYKVPFLFAAAPLAGYLYELTGSYRLPIFVHIASFVVVALLFALFRPKSGAAVAS